MLAGMERLACCSLLSLAFASGLAGQDVEWYLHVEPFS